MKKLFSQWLRCDFCGALIQIWAGDKPMELDDENRSKLAKKKGWEWNGLRQESTCKKCLETEKL